MDKRSETMQDLLCALLGCGYLDLPVVLDCEYDFGEIIDHIKDNFGDEQKIDLNFLAYIIVEFGKNELINTIDERISDLQDELESESISDEEKEELESLRKLSPHDDISSFHNYLDTHVYLESNEEIYRDYLGDELSDFEIKTGLNIQ